MAATLTLSICCLVLALVIGSAWAAFGFRRLADKERAARADAQRAESAAKDQAEQRLDELVKAQVATGTQMVAEYRYGEAALYFAEAVRLDREHPVREQLHRIRCLSAIASRPKPILVWHAGQPVFNPFIHDARSSTVGSVRFTDDGSFLVTGSKFGNRDRCCLWNTKTGQMETVPLDGYFRDVNADGSRVLTKSDRVLLLWELDDDGPAPTPISTIQIAPVGMAKFGPYGRFVLTGGENNSLLIWDDQTGRPAFDPLVHTNGVQTADFIADGRKLITLDDHALVRIWDLATAFPPCRVLRVAQYEYPTAVFSSSRRLVGLRKNGGESQVWDLTTNREIGLNIQQPGAVRPHVEFSPDERLYLLYGYDDRQALVRIWDLRSKERIAEIAEDVDVGVLNNVQNRFNHATFSPDGRYMATASENKVARIWDSRTLRPVSPPLEHDFPVGRAFFSRDGSRLATCAGPAPGMGATGGFGPGEARVWEVPTGTPLSPSIPHDASA